MAHSKVKRSSQFESLHINQLLKTHQPNLVEQKDNLMEERRLLKKDLASSFSHRDSEQLLQIETKLASILKKSTKKK